MKWNGPIRLDLKNCLQKWKCHILGFVCILTYFITNKLRTKVHQIPFGNLTQFALKITLKQRHFLRWIINFCCCFVANWNNAKWNSIWIQWIVTISMNKKFTKIKMTLRSLHCNDCRPFLAIKFLSHLHTDCHDKKLKRVLPFFLLLLSMQSTWLKCFVNGHGYQAPKERRNKKQYACACCAIT